MVVMPDKIIFSSSKDEALFNLKSEESQKAIIESLDYFDNVILRAVFNNTQYYKFNSRFIMENLRRAYVDALLIDDRDIRIKELNDKIREDIRKELDI